MLRRAMLLSVLFGLGMQTSLWGDIINVPDDQPTIQAAIDAAADGDEIIVAPGTYFENIYLLGKAVTLRSSAGPEVTIIDANGSGTVVTCDSGEGPNTIIDGFTITGGVGTEFEVFPGVFWIAGGGMLNGASGPTVSDCRFSGNEALVGGGMSNVSSSPTVTNCTFSGNSSSSGGGMANFNGGSPIVTGCMFSDNWAIGGGGMANRDSDPTVANCTFNDNFAVDSGGGMANWGGAPTVTNCTFSENLTPGQGGGMSNVYSSSPTVTNCTFRDNWSINDRGGGLSAWVGSSPTVANCTFTENTGGGMWMKLNSWMTVTNCILWNNTPNELLGVIPTVTYSDVKGGIAGEGNIDVDPQFVDPNNGDYHLLPGSPCIDAADNTGVPADTQDLDGDGNTDEPVPVDLDGNPRFVDDPDTPDTGNPDGIHPIVDMGAFEFGPPDPCADEDGDGSVTICHIPPGNPDAAHTITVSVNALPAHLAHGDHCGACEEDDGLLMGGNSDVNAELCPTDLDDSGDIGAADVTQLLGSWGPCAGCPADFNGDGVVGAFDLAQLLGAWGPCE